MKAIQQPQQPQAQQTTKEIKFVKPTRQQLIERSRILFKGDPQAQLKWVKASQYLYETGKHVLLTGKYNGGR